MKNTFLTVRLSSPGLLLLFLLLFQHTAYSQQFGGNPSSIRWRQINTDTVRVIFPEGLDSVAQRVAALTHYEQQQVSRTIGDKIRKVNIVLQRDVTFSNGYVALGPYRSEFYLMPPLNAFQLGAQRWSDNLAIHEFRHVQQYSNFRRGMSRVMFYIFGEDGQALANAASVPNWFFEGDAVYNETMLSHQGRGRLPSFLNSYRSLYNADKHYSYMKLRNGSLKSYVPDHYPLGYMFVAYGREKYGADFWRKVTQDAAAFKPLLYPLQGAVKKYAGIPFSQFTRDAMSYYDRQWDSSKNQSLQWISNIQKNNVVDYKYPYTMNDGSLIVLKDSYKDIPAFYKLTNDKTFTKIATRDISYDDYFSYNNNKIAYACYQADTRWGNKEYSVIRILDINTGEVKKISSHTRYFMPDISHSGKSIVAVSVRADQRCDVDILTTTGIKTTGLITNDQLIYSYPKFSADDRSVFLIARNNAGEMSLLKKEISTGKTTIILPFANRIIGFPVVKGDTLLYTCSAKDEDAIWAYVMSQGKSFRLAGYSTGLYQATFNTGNQLVSSAFTADGYRLARITPQWQPIDTGDTLTNLYVKQPFNIPANNTIATAGNGQYPVCHYPRLFHPFNFHSLHPSINDPDYSVILYGENVLNTLQSQLYYDYNRNEGFSRVGYTATYGGWYVQPFVGVNETFQRNGLLSNGTQIYWNEAVVSGGLQLPLNLSGGKQYRYLTISSSYNTDNVQWTGAAKGKYNNLHFDFAQATLQYIGQVQSSAQNIYPRWAQTLIVQYRSIINNYTANQLLVSGALYLPGIAKSHSLVLNAAYQSRDTANEYSFSNSFPFSRGYVVYDFPRLWKLGANYHFPVWYPDQGIANVVYFTRIRANAFYDYTVGRNLRTQTNYQFKTVGAELYFDTKWWNQQPVTFGIRYSRLLDYQLSGQQPDQWEIILPINLLNN